MEITKEQREMLDTEVRKLSHYLDDGTYRDEELLYNMLTALVIGCVKKL